MTATITAEGTFTTSNATPTPLQIALSALAEIAGNPNKDPDLRVAAAKAILDYHRL